MNALAQRQLMIHFIWEVLFFQLPAIEELKVRLRKKEKSFIITLFFHFSWNGIPNWSNEFFKKFNKKNLQNDRNSKNSNEKLSFRACISVKSQIYLPLIKLLNRSSRPNISWKSQPLYQHRLRCTSRTRLSMILPSLLPFCMNNRPLRKQRVHILNRIDHVLEKNKRKSTNEAMFVRSQWKERK